MNEVCRKTHLICCLPCYIVTLLQRYKIKHSSDDRNPPLSHAPVWRMYGTDYTSQIVTIKE